MVQEQSQYGMLKHKHLPQKLLAINTLNISITFHLAEWKMQSWGKTRGKERLGGLRGSSGSSYSLVNDQVWSKAQQVAIGLLVGPPAQSKSHQEHPGVLQQGHLVIQVQIPETWRNKNWRGTVSGVKKQQKWLWWEGSRAMSSTELLSVHRQWQRWNIEKSQCTYVGLSGTDGSLRYITKGNNSSSHALQFTGLPSKNNRLSSFAPEQPARQ